MAVLASNPYRYDTQSPARVPDFSASVFREALSRNSALVNGNDDPDLCCPEGIKKYTENVVNWWGGVLKGDYNTDPSVSQIFARTLLTMIPFVDQGGDIQDLTANLYNCYKKGRVDASDGMAIALTAIGAVPELGSALKGSLKIVLAASKELVSGKAGDAVNAMKRLMSIPGVPEALSKFSSSIADFKKQAIAGVNTAFDKAIQLKPEMTQFIAQKRNELINQMTSGFDTLKKKVETVKNGLQGNTPAGQGASHHSPGSSVPGANGAAPKQKFFLNGSKPPVFSYAWGKAIKISNFPEGVSVADKAIYIRDAMKAAGVDMVVLPKGGEKGKIMAELQKIDQKEYLYVRAVEGTGSGERVLIRGDESSVAHQKFKHVPIAHTHPPSSLVAKLGEYAGVMPSADDIAVLRQIKDYTSSLIIDETRRGVRHIDFGGLLAKPKVVENLSHLSQNGRAAFIKHIDQQRSVYKEIELDLSEYADDLGRNHPKYNEIMEQYVAYKSCVSDCDAMKRILQQSQKIQGNK